MTILKKLVLGAVALAGLTAATPSAQAYYYHHHYYRHGWYGPRVSYYGGPYYADPYYDSYYDGGYYGGPYYSPGITFAFGGHRGWGGYGGGYRHYGHYHRR